MRRRAVMLGTLCCLAPLAGALETVSPKEQEMWLRHLIPLPHQIAIRQKAVLSPKDVRFTVRANPTPIETNAVGQLAELWRAKAGRAPAGDKFEIVIGVLDENGKVAGADVRGLDRLKSAPNNSQAYILQPAGENRLVLAALDGRGVFYATVTLRQLLEPSLSADSVSIPLAEILDWPDIEERGLWNQPLDWAPWMASLKMNYAKMPASTDHRIERGKANAMRVDADLIKRARLYGVNFLPNITHLNFMAPWGLYDAYPELAGKGDQAAAGHYHAHRQSGRENRAPCASNPMLSQILSEWMIDMASKGITEISGWLSERPAQCQCETCLKEGQFVWEARAFVSAWQTARRTYPALVLRLFISTTTNEKYEQALAEAPPEVKLERCCAAELDRVRHEPRDRFVNPGFDAVAAKGRWVASYDVPIPANGNVETPEFKVPESSAHRIKDFVIQLHARKYSGAYGMTGWSNMAREICGFNYHALAEWSWNANGRSEREFAIAWATREGYEAPERVGDWSDLMGPVEFDVYASGFPTCYSWGHAAKMIQDRQAPVLGQGMFRYYATPASFDEKLAACDKAMSVAKSFRSPYLADETRVVRSYVDMARHIYLLARLASSGEPAPRAMPTQADLLDGLQKAGKENVEAITQWRRALGPEPWHPRVHDAIKGTETTVTAIIAALGGQP